MKDIMRIKSLVSADIENAPLDLDAEEIVLNSFTGSISINIVISNPQKLRVTVKQLL